jgi:penicillin G amidase
MKIVKFLVSLLLTVGAIYFLNRPISLKEPSKDDPAKMKETVIPPVGPFFSPFSGFWQNAEPLKGFASSKIEVPEMKGKVKILFDERLVPHIFAENTADMAFAQGYVVAQNRLWQMDMIARLSGGRLAEVMGRDLLENDQLQRRRGMVAGAEKAVAAWQKSPGTYRLIEAYVAGVNTYINQMKPKDLPLEFKLLNYQPEQWSVLKTALVKKYMDMTLCFGEDDLEATNAMQIFGKETFDKLYPEYNPKQSPVIPAGTKWAFSPAPAGPKTEIQEAIGLIHHKIYEKERELVGSNNWAVSGTKTKSGHPILCNDPHLRLSLPSIWYEVQLNSPDMNAYGVSVPGIPGILIGFNENIAWGETNVGHDVLDWYKINWTDDAKTTYQLDGGVKKVELVVNSFKVRGEEAPVLDTVKWTSWGPIVYESDQKPWNDLAMHWIGHLEPNAQDISTFLGLNTGKDFDDYNTALQHYDYPAQNFVFASKTGDVAITVNGNFPVKAKEQGRFIQNGDSPRTGWEGWIPRPHVPQSRNPARGFVASANQHSTDPTYPYYYNSTHFDHFRGRYLAGQLTQMDSITVEDMMKLQNNNFSIHASEGLPAMIKQVDTTQLSAMQAGILKKMQSWDFHFEKDKAEPVVFVKWWDKFYEMTFDEVLVWEDSLPVLRPENWRLIEFATDSPGDLIFDNQKTPERETAKNIATAAFIATVDSLAGELVKPGFNWAAEKKTSIYHMARIPAFSRMNLDVGGYRQALNAISETHGPSWRMVVELGDEVKAWGVFPGGQSGNPGSIFYDTGLEKWSKGEYNELFFMKNADDNRKPVLYSIEIN